MRRYETKVFEVDNVKYQYVVDDNNEQLVALEYKFIVFLMKQNEGDEWEVDIFQPYKHLSSAKTYCNKMMPTLGVQEGRRAEDRELLHPST